MQVFQRPAVLGIALVALVGLSAAAPAAADPRAEQERIDEEVAEAAAVLENATEQARTAATRYAAANAELPAAEARVDEARGVVVAAEVRIRTAEREAEQAEQELVVASDTFQESTGAVTDARDQVSDFAVAAYKGSAVASFNLLLNARDPNEMIERLGYVEHVSTAQRDALDHLAGTRLGARQAENDAAVAHDRAEQARLAAATALVEAEAAAEAAEAAAAEVTALAEERAESLAAAEAERDESLDRYEAAEVEAERIAQEVRAWEEARRAAGPSGSAHAASPDRTSVLAMPTDGFLSSPYGMRHDPFFQLYRLHAGIDIAAGGGTPVYAAERGTVITAGWNGGYGNYTCLGHGDHQGKGLATCYAHQSAILVSVGQSVARGELIGRVGTTGASTGNHLHFEVRLDGTPTDPVAFLPGF